MEAKRSAEDRMHVAFTTDEHSLLRVVQGPPYVSDSAVVAVGCLSILQHDFLALLLALPWSGYQLQGDRGIVVNLFVDGVL